MSSYKSILTRLEYPTIACFDLDHTLIKPKSGKIYIDNKEVNLNNTNWQKLIGYVPQDVYLLDDSIRRNIIFGRKCGTKDEKKNLQNFKIIKFK